jgi:hypothetical protein
MRRAAMMTLDANRPHACPRCRGKLLTAQDQHGAYRSCLTCGYVEERLSGPAIDRPTEADSRRRWRQPSHGRRRL